MNGDGFLDIYVSKHRRRVLPRREPFPLGEHGEVGLMREGIAPYVDRSEQLGLSRSSWGWDTRLGDFNNDGAFEALQATGFVRGDKNKWPELHELATSNDQLLSSPQAWLACRPGDDLSGQQHIRFYSLHGSGRYYDVAGEIRHGTEDGDRGIATADVDGDGADGLPPPPTSGIPRSTSITSRAARDGFSALHLRLPVGSQDLPTVIQDGTPRRDQRVYPAIGAQATLFLPDGKKLVAQVDGGNGHSGKRSPDLQFGLGTVRPTSRSASSLHGAIRAAPSIIKP